MGADRLKDQKDQAKRGWNNAGQRLMQPPQLSLFAADPVLGKRSFKICLCGEAKANVGDELLLQTANDNQFVTRGPQIIGNALIYPRRSSINSKLAA
jgi:hypothetical protein